MNIWHFVLQTDVRISLLFCVPTQRKLWLISIKQEALLQDTSIFFAHLLTLSSSTTNSPGSQMSGARVLYWLMKHVTCISPASTSCPGWHPLLFFALHSASRAGNTARQLRNCQPVSTILLKPCQNNPSALVRTAAPRPNTVYGGHFCTNILSVSAAQPLSDRYSIPELVTGQFFPAAVNILENARKKMRAVAVTLNGYPAKWTRFFKTSVKRTSFSWHL